MSAVCEVSVAGILLAENLDIDNLVTIGSQATQYKTVSREVQDAISNIESSSLSDKEARLAAAYWMLRDFKEATKHARSNSSSGAAVLVEGLICEEEGKFEEALKLYQKAETISPSATPCVLRQISALRKLSKIDEALELVEKLRREFGDKPNFFYNEGRCYEDISQQQKALDCYLAALEIDENHPEANFRAALLCDLRGLDDEARKFYEKIGPNARNAFMNATLNLALLYEDNEQYEEAVMCCENVLRIDPTNRRARLFRRTAHASSDMYYSPEETKQSERLEAVLRIPVTDFELSVRSRNCLARMNIHTIGDLVKRTESEMLAYKNFGETSLREIREILNCKNLRLGMMREDAATRAAFGRNAGQADSDVSEKSLDELELSVRSRKCMDGMGLGSVGELISKSEAELAAAKNFGRVSLNEIKKRLHEMGLSLREDG